MLGKLATVKSYSATPFLVEVILTHGYNFFDSRLGGLAQIRLFCNISIDLSISLLNG